MTPSSNTARPATAWPDCVVIPFRPRRTHHPRAAAPTPPAPQASDRLLMTALTSAALAAFISLAVGWVDASRWIETALRAAVAC